MRFLIPCTLVLAILFQACGSGTQTKTDNGGTEEVPESVKIAQWSKAMDAFHLVLAETYHPMEDGNMQPMHNQAEELAQKALDWSNTPLPAGFAQSKMRDELKKLAAEARDLANEVKAGASDFDLRNAMTTFHEHFHDIDNLHYKLTQQK